MEKESVVVSICPAQGFVSFGDEKRLVNNWLKESGQTFKGKEYTILSNVKEDGNADFNSTKVTIGGEACREVSLI